jgi:hypothetical protein
VTHVVPTEQLLPIWAGLLLLVACGGPTRLADGPYSPASPEADEGAAAVVTRALEEEPPLPGEDLSGWEGLGSAEIDSVDPLHEHEGHHGEGGHDRERDLDHEHGPESHEDLHEHDPHGTSGTKANDEPPPLGHHVVD